MKIEPGCLALVVASASHVNIGKCVRVGKFLGEVPTFTGNDRWEVDKAMQGNFGRTAYHQNEKHLIRIDGQTDVKEIKKAEYA